jgi:hypothetical protein
MSLKLSSDYILSQETIAQNRLDMVAGNLSELVSIMKSSMPDKSGPQQTRKKASLSWFAINRPYIHDTSTVCHLVPSQPSAHRSLNALTVRQRAQPRCRPPLSLQLPSGVVMATLLNPLARRLTRGSPTRTLARMHPWPLPLRLRQAALQLLRRLTSLAQQRRPQAATRDSLRGLWPLFPAQAARTSSRAAWRSAKRILLTPALRTTRTRR